MKQNERQFSMSDEIVWSNGPLPEPVNVLLGEDGIPRVVDDVKKKGRKKSGKMTPEEKKEEITKAPEQKKLMHEVAFVMPIGKIIVKYSMVDIQFPWLILVADKDQPDGQRFWPSNETGKPLQLRVVLYPSDEDSRREFETLFFGVRFTLANYEIMVLMLNQEG